MGTVATWKKGREELRRLGEDVGGKVWQEAERNISDVAGSTGTKGGRGDVRREERAEEAAAVTAIGPKATALTGELGLSLQEKRLKRRRRYSALMSNYGTLSTGRPTLLGA